MARDDDDDDDDRASIARAKAALDALARGELRARATATARGARAVAHFAKTRTRGGGDASGATTRTRDDGARDGGEGIAPRALVCVFERPRRARDERDGSESESESERETAETTAGAAYGTRVEIRRWTRDSNVGGGVTVIATMTRWMAMGRWIQTPRTRTGGTRAVRARTSSSG